MKTCNRCKTEKPETEFYKNKQTADGLFYHCKECQKEVNNKRNREKKKENPYRFF